MVLVLEIENQRCEFDSSAPQQNRTKVEKNVKKGSKWSHVNFGFPQFWLFSSLFNSVGLYRLKFRMFCNNRVLCNVLPNITILLYLLPSPRLNSIRQATVLLLLLSPAATRFACNPWMHFWTYVKHLRSLARLLKSALLLFQNIRCQLE